MQSFQHNGDTHPMPPGWHGLSCEDWFYKLELVRDRLMHADELGLAPMTNEDGDALDAEEVVLVHEGFRSGGHWEAFRSWGVGARAVGRAAGDGRERQGHRRSARAVGDRSRAVGIA